MTDDKRDGFMEQAADKARELFSGSGSDRQAGTVPAGTTSHYSAQTGEVRVGGQTTSDRYRDDAHYAAARAQHLGDFDRDYHDYRQEHQATGSDHARGDFGAWRTQRQGRPDTRAIDENSRALGESPNQGSEGPHILDRSFSGTYDDPK